MSSKQIVIIVACVLSAFFLGRKSTVLFKGFTIRGSIFNYREVPERPVDTSRYRYTDNPYYATTMRTHKAFTGTYKVVMLGNSMVSGIAWNELLGRGDIANRGIGGDLAEGLYNRLETVYVCEPELCFIECGINDIRSGITLDEYTYYMGAVVDSLQEHKIKPVMTHIMYLGSKYPKADSLNRIVDVFNGRIEDMGKQKGFDRIDLNRQMGPNGYLEDKYLLFDNLHLGTAGYDVWGAEVMKYL